MATTHSACGRKLRDAELVWKVFRYNAAPSDERSADEPELNRQLEEADRRSTALDETEQRRQQQRALEWLEDATGEDGNTDPMTTRREPFAGRAGGS
jgi:hypothetical protein